MICIQHNNTTIYICIYLYEIGECMADDITIILTNFPPLQASTFAEDCPRGSRGGVPPTLWQGSLNGMLCYLCKSMQIYANLCKSYWSFVSGAEIPPKKPECLGLVSYNDPLLLAIHHNVYQFLSSKTWRKTHRIPIHFWENETKRYFKPQAQIVPKSWTVNGDIWRENHLYIASWVDSLALSMIVFRESYENKNWKWVHSILFFLLHNM